MEFIYWTMNDDLLKPIWWYIFFWLNRNLTTTILNSFLNYVTLKKHRTSSTSHHKLYGWRETNLHRILIKIVSSSLIKIIMIDSVRLKVYQHHIEVFWRRLNQIVLCKKAIRLTVASHAFTFFYYGVTFLHKPYFRCDLFLVWLISALHRFLGINTHLF